MAVEAPSTNVVRLPTAAKRKVQQFHNRHVRAEALRLRKEWRGKYVLPGVRAAMSIAKDVNEIGVSPISVLLHATLGALDQDTLRKVTVILMAGVASGSDACRCALSLVKTITFNFGQQAHFLNAQKRLQADD